jgi:hypothetical protein
MYIIATIYNFVNLAIRNDMDLTSMNAFVTNNFL